MPVNSWLTIRRCPAGDFNELVAIDDDACRLFETVGLNFDFAADHSFAVSEHSRWIRAGLDGNAFLATLPDGLNAGMLVMGFVDGEPYLDQISVRPEFMRRGIGRSLLEHALRWAGSKRLWLTTYSHVPWNRPFYERLGFECVPEPNCPESIRGIIAEGRRWLPRPEQRIAMRHTP